MLVIVPSALLTDSATPQSTVPCPSRSLRLHRAIRWRKVAAFALAESARLMPVTASPQPALMGAYAGLIS
jgi:hypothetical protein